jgi:hypothetical protein
MTLKYAPLGLLFAALLTACSTPQSRIEQNRAAFEKYPADVQQKISAGHVDIGFTPDMVLMALGDPAKKWNVKSDKGETEVWSYHDNAPQFSFGIGVGSVGPHGGASVGVGSTTGGYEPDEKMRVQFNNGHVTLIEFAH